MMTEQNTTNDAIVFKGPVLWSQIDANFHLRHSAYADFAAQGRVALLEATGLGIKQLLRLHLGPILFREELLYHREVMMNDVLSVSCRLSKLKADGSKFSFVQSIYRQDGIKAATVIVDGAWMDTQKRKITALPAELINEFLDKTPKTDDFELIP